MDVFLHAATTLGLSMAAPALLCVLFTVSASGIRTRMTAVAERFRLLRGLLWLGVATHECGHLLLCLCTFTPVKQISIKWHSGFVKHIQRGAVVSTLIAVGPIVSSTLAAWLLSTLMFGQTFRSAAAPFRAPLHGTGVAWAQQAAHALITETASLLTRQMWWHIPALLLLAGIVSAAAPSVTDLRAAARGLVLLTVVAIGLEILGRVLLHTSMVAHAGGGLATVCTALGIATFACLLGWVAVLPLAWLAGR